MSEVKPIEYKDLIAPKNFDQVLLPRQIPIHPEVYNSEFAYTEEFIQAVVEAVP